MIDYIPKIQEWQLHRLLDSLSRSKSSFPGLWVNAFYIRHDGIDEVQFSALYKPRVVKTMGQRDIQWYRDTWFSLPHAAVQVGFNDKVLVVGFWADNMQPLRDWLKEKMPDVDTLDSTERILSGRIFVE